MQCRFYEQAPGAGGMATGCAVVGCGRHPEQRALSRGRRLESLLCHPPCGKTALYVHDISAESHAAVNRLFGLHLIRPGDIERAWSSYLVEGLDDRLAADYDTEVSFSADETAGECRRAGEFVERVRQYLITKGFSTQEL